MKNVQLIFPHRAIFEMDRLLERNN